MSLIICTIHHTANELPGLFLMQAMKGRGFEHGNEKRSANSVDHFLRRTYDQREPFPGPSLWSMTVALSSHVESRLDIELPRYVNEYGRSLFDHQNAIYAILLQTYADSRHFSGFWSKSELLRCWKGGYYRSKSRCSSVHRYFLFWVAAVSKRLRSLTWRIKFQ